MSFILVFVFMLVFVGMMAVGVIFGREPIRGSCGGLGQLGIDAECRICGGSPQRCAEARAPRSPGAGTDAVTEFDPSDAERRADPVD